MRRPPGAKVVVITGASSGIGRETARQFGAGGASVVLAARNEEALAATADEVERAGGTALVVPTDVAERSQVDALAARTFERFGRIDTWVNNAAVSGFGELAEMPIEAIERIVQVDLLGQIYGAKAALAIMRTQGYGHIIGIASAIGVRSIPLQVPYCIAKAGTVALYEGLRMEERHARSGVEITTILPSTVDTPFYDVVPSWMGRRPAAIPPVYQPAAVAEAIVAAAERTRRQIYVGGAGAQLALLQRLSPALTDRVLAVADQIFVRQQSDEPDRGQSNLWDPQPGPGAVRGESVGFAFRRSWWARVGGYHPAPARIVAGAATAGLAWRSVRRRR